MPVYGIKHCANLSTSAFDHLGLILVKFC